MDMSKITRPQVLIIAAVLTVIVAIGVYFGLIRPLNDRMAAANAKYESAKLIADTRPQKEKLKKDNQAKVKKAEADWAVYDQQLNRVAKKNTDYIDVSNLWTATTERWDWQIKRLGYEVKKFAEADKSVKVYTSISVPPPPVDPNQNKVKYIDLPLGTVTVVGTFDNILKHLTRWNRFNRLVVVDASSVTGNSPQLTCQYSLNCYVFTHGADKPGADIPQAGNATGGGGGIPSFGGGPPGGFGGYPGAGGGGYPGAGGGGKQGGAPTQAD